MYTLGLTHPMAWNNAAALLKEGELVMFVEEERLNRFKQSPGIAPLLALEACLAAAGIGLSDVDLIGIGWDPSAKHRSKDRIVWDFQFKQLPLDPGDRRLRWVRHHVAHALSALWCSGFEKAAVLSLDGTGEFESGLLGLGEGPDVKILETIPRQESWGYVFGRITEKLGFRGHRDEGKVMGLAAYAAPDPALFDFIDWRRQIPRIDKKRFKKFLLRTHGRRPEEEIEPAHRILAATVQWAYEKALVAMARRLRKKTGLDQAVLAGGCALNCAANGVLAREGLFRRIFVQPAAHDAGTALGAAFEAYRAARGRRASGAVFTHAYFGPGFSDGEIGKLLEEAALPRVVKSRDPAAQAAALLARGSVVGWFQGRMEAGPRALGNRSILADPRSTGLRDRVNALKGREEWRPLAPSILAEDYASLVEGDVVSPFMLVAQKATALAKELIPGVVHVDGTVRAQFVEKETNPLLHALLSEFKRLTGVGAVLNTSFNARGEPLVCTPRDALQTFYSTGLDALVMGNHVVRKA